MSHGQFVEAEQALRRSLDLGESPEALNTLAAVLTYQQRDQESVTYLNRAAQWWPDRYLVWLNLGTSYRRLGLHPDAERAYRRGLELARSEMSTIPRSGYIRACAAYMNAWLGNRIQAESELAQAMQLSPNNANVLRMAVKVYEALGQRDQSIALLKRVPDEVRADIGRFPDLADLHRDLRFQALNPPTAGKP